MIGGPRVVAGLDVGSTKTCAVIAEVAGPARAGAGDGVRILGAGLVPTEGVRNRNVTNIEAATESIRDALRDAEEMAGIEVPGVYASVAGDHVEVTCSSGVVAISGREIGASDLEEVHEVARSVPVPPDRELIHAIPQEYIVDGHSGIQDPRGMEAIRLESEVCIVTAGAAPCQNLRKAVDRAGYRVDELVLAPLASNLAVLGEEARVAGVALIELGGAATETVVFKDGRLRLVATLPWGSTTISNDIAKGLGVPMQEAERLKELHATAQPRADDDTEPLEVPGPVPGGTRKVSRELLAHIVHQRLDEMFGLVYEALEEKQLLGTLGSGIVLTGGGAELDGAAELAEEVFNMSVAVGAPGPGITGITDVVGTPKHATAVGLALYGRLRDQDRGGVAMRALARLTDWLREYF